MKAMSVTPGKVNDKMVVALSGFKPGLQFALFTVESSPLRVNGSFDPNFKNVGMAWYQSLLLEGRNTIRSILIDVPFGLNPRVSLPPTFTFHVGFWFTNPNDAVACGFDPSKPTFFDGDLEAGPVAFISRPNRDTGVGPLCVNVCKSKKPVELRSI